jgi:translation elongation factor EF-Ts
MSQGFAPSRAERETRRFVQVQRMRHATGAARQECEHALTECRGNTDAAIEWLRRSGRAH